MLVEVVVVEWYQGFVVVVQGFGQVFDLCVVFVVDEEGECWGEIEGVLYMVVDVMYVLVVEVEQCFQY